MTDKEKANNIATNNLDRCFGNKQDYGATCALEFAAWKEQQMIEKAVEWLEPVFKGLAGYNCGGDLINSFKKAMEE